ncbi:hypothetical protein [Butyrivibrio sp. AE2032]|uniref:hypothetical protein n=1 Tax=Butyrivibrio sp. AE2032 TaxID=1458463 RepID=UPI000557501C|nr:hypothetical protein [Butyrivibrio sp. AE2032]
MKKTTITILSICILTLTAQLSGCGRLNLSEDQKEAITETKDELKENVSAAVEELSKSVETISEHTLGAEDYFKEKNEDVKNAASEAISAAEAGSALMGQSTTDDSAKETSDEAGLLTSPEDIALTDVDGNGKNYTFMYDGETFKALYTSDNWKIYNSYRITNEADITIICQALIEEHPIHGSDLVSYRTPEDMAYEWIQHNIAYVFLSDDSSFKTKARDVDLNPEDQGKSFEEIYKARTGKELSIEDIMKYLGN